MATLRGARGENPPKIMFTFPTFNWTPGSSYPIPYPIEQTLEDGKDLSEDVRYNEEWVFLQSSYVEEVTGDKAGSNGGVISTTTSDRAEPMATTGASSVQINGENAIRTGDIFWMNEKNTFGYLKYDESEKDAITDEGKVADAIPAPQGIIGFISSLF
jgi:hypothetical protein